MLIGAHVSTAGGLDKAIERGEDMGCDAIQIFNQSPRMWRPTAYSAEDFARFREKMTDSRIESVVIHAIYLINPGSFDKELAQKSLVSLTHALSVGDGIASDGVVLHPGHVMEGHEYPETVKLVAKTIKQALKDTDECPLLLENATGKRAIGLKFEHLRDLIDLLDGDDRVGVCLDSCHSLAAGYDGRTNEALTETIDEFDEIVGLDRLKCIHLNDSKGEFGSHKDRHENLGEGELGKQGCAAWLSEPRFESLPVLMEIPGHDGKGPAAPDVKLAHKLRKQGLKSRV